MRTKDIVLNREASKMGPNATKSLLKYVLCGGNRPYGFADRYGRDS